MCLGHFDLGVIVGYGILLLGICIFYIWVVCQRCLFFGFFLEIVGGLLMSLGLGWIYVEICYIWGIVTWKNFNYMVSEELLKYSIKENHGNELKNIWDNNSTVKN